MSRKKFDDLASARSERRSGILFHPDTEEARIRSIRVNLAVGRHLAGRHQNDYEDEDDLLIDSRVRFFSVFAGSWAMFPGDEAISI